MGVNLGIDIGSVATKCVIVKDNRIISKALTKTGVDTERSAETVFNESLRNASLSESDIASIVSTGYSRRLFKKAKRVITEISAVAAGAFFLTGRKDCLIIDLGGQDTKIVEVGDNGEVVDFLMNDRCAAGTGRFLEMMAGILETDLNGISELALKSRNPVSINSTCSVFAESEVVSLLSHASKKEDIAEGLVNAIAARVAVMIGQFGQHKFTLFCGGGAESHALKNALEQASNRTITVLDNPQFVTAFGAALSYAS